MSSNPALSPKVKFRTISSDSLVRQHEPKPEKDVVYEFSNGRQFKQPINKNPYITPGDNDDDQ